MSYDTNAKKPILFFMLSCAAQGARFKLRSHGTRSSQSALTIEGPPGVVQGIFQEFYQYTLRQFPHLATRLPMRPPILDHVTDAETNDKDAGAEMKDESSSNSAAGGCAPASSGEHVSESHIDPNVHYESTDSENDDSEDIQEAELVHDDEVPDPDQESSSDELVVDEVVNMIQPTIDMLKENLFRLKEKVNTTHFAVMSPPLDLLLTVPNSEYNGSKDIEQAKIEHDGMVSDSDKESYSEELVIDEVSQMIQPSIDMLKKKSISIEGEGEHNSLCGDVPAF